MMLWSSSERRKREMRTELVRSVMSKHSTALPRFCRRRLVTATTSPSTVTLPDSRVRVFMGTGRCLMARPISTSPLGAPPGLKPVSAAAVEAILGRGYSGISPTPLRP